MDDGTADTFARVDDYLGELFVGDDPVLDATLRRATEAGLPEIAVSPMLGRLLQVLTAACGARRVLEVGTLAGYSTIHLARALPADGEVVTIERSPDHAEVARANVAAADLAASVDVRVGAASDVLAALADEDAGPFDLVFIDADKAPYAEYLAAALRLARPGTVLVADNVVRGGAVTDADDDRADVVGVRRFNAALAADDRLTATVTQVVGAKGHDGIAIAVVR
jgi:caffeoyl-CoA O-methyltransferase